MALTLFVAAGCALEDGSPQVVHESSNPDCNQPAEQGACLALLKRWTYHSGACFEFTYSGCGPTGSPDSQSKNIFTSFEACRDACFDD